MVQVLDGNPQTGLTVDEIRIRLAADLGYNANRNRYKNRVLYWINGTIRKIQLADPQNRRAVVHDAEVTIKAGVTEVDVRLSVANGGWALSNCYQIRSITVPLWSDLPLDVIGLDKLRHRGEALTSITGPPHSIVLIDDTRVRIDPLPDADYAARVDYLQLFPELSDGAARVSWPETWDEVLFEGVLFEAYRVHYKETPSVWQSQRKIYQEALADLVEGQQTTAERPRRTVVTRAIRSRRHIPHDNSTDRYRY